MGIEAMVKAAINQGTDPRDYRKSFAARAGVEVEAVDAVIDELLDEGTLERQSDLRERGYLTAEDTPQSYQDWDGSPEGVEDDWA